MSADVSRSRRDAGAVFVLALAARLAVVVWAAPRFPPTADGTFYQRVAERIAAGLGYTWLWPDGVVTYAAHYPVGYPAAVGAIYALFGPHPAGAMVLNAAVGALAALGVHRLAARAAPDARWVAVTAGVLVALHPGLVAYTPAVMTEGVTASLIACAAWAAGWARDARPSLGPFAILGGLIGAATLVRPQSLLLAPLLAAIALAGPDSGRRFVGLSVVDSVAQSGSGTMPSARRAAAWLGTVLVALLVCAPWTARNCVRMKRCALVSVNGGWNLLIGADPASTGAWSPIQVPEACRTVFDEAGKDACFGREARRFILEHPGAWLALAPKKLAATFDYSGAAGWYLHDANPSAFRYEDKVALGVVETAYERGILLFALAGGARGSARATDDVADGSRRRRRRAATVVRLVVFGVGAFAAVQLHAWIGYVALLVLALLKGRALASAPVLVSSAFAVLAATALTHAVFFGAGRYALVTFPLLTGLAAVAAVRHPRRSDGPGRSSPRAEAGPARSTLPDTGQRL